MRKICIGSRESKLAVVQTEMVREAILAAYPEMEIDILTMKTTGDIILDRTLDKIGGKGLFVKELDRALGDGRSDLSVHSLKDMPMEVEQGLPLLAFMRREDPRDVLVLPLGCERLKTDGVIGCSSLRRTVQLKRLFPEAVFKPVRGNVLTRLGKLDGGEYDALVLAAAGLKRLGLDDRISRYFTAEEVIPAAGQGIIAVQGRAGEDYSYLDAVNDEDASYVACCERAFTAWLDGGCSSPVAAHAVREGDRIRVTGLYFDDETQDYITGSLSGGLEEAESLGRQLAQRLKEQFQKGED